MRIGKFLVVVVAALTLYGLALAAPTRSTTAVNQTTSGPAMNLESVGHVGGQVSAVAMSGNYAYVGQHSELAVLDITNSAQPGRVGGLSLGASFIRKIVLTGHYAVVGMNNGMVRLVDVTDPAQLVIVGELQVTDNLLDLAADAQYMYVLGGGATVANKLDVIDISDPTMPVVVGSFQAAYFSVVLAVNGQSAFLYESFGKLHTIDLTAPTHPVETGEYPVSGYWVWDMVAHDHYMYVVTEGDGATVGPMLHVLDATQPAALAQIGAVNLHDLGWGDGYYSDLTVSNNRFYLAGSTLQIIDVIDPAHPAFRGEYAGATMGQHGSASGNRAVVGTFGRGWRVLDVTNAQQPVELGAYDPPPYVIATALSNDIAYVANGGFGLRVVNIADSRNPVVLPVVPSGAAEVVRVQGSHVYVLARPNELRVLNVATPANPITLKTYNFAGQMEDFEVAGQYAYVADAAFGLRVYNISQPTAWVSASNVPLPGAHDIMIAGSRAYVLAADASGEVLNTVDVVNPLLPTVSSTWRPSHGLLTDMWVDNQLAYVTFRARLNETNTGLMIVDVSDPALPHQVGEWKVSTNYNPNDPVVSVSVAGWLAYLAQPFSGLRVIDVSVPTQPIELERHFTPGSTWSVIATGSRVYVNTQEGGLSIYEMHGNTAGQLLDGAHLPLALPGVKISAGANFSTTTNVSGSFDLRSLPVGLNTITPTLDGYVFVPPTMTVQTPSAYQGALNFVVLVAPMSITVTPGVISTLAYTEPNGAVIEAMFSADVMSQTTTITLTPTLAEGGVDQWFTGHAFDLATPIGLRPDLAFNAPVTITVRYTDRDVSVIGDEAALQLTWWDGAQWMDAASTCSPTSNYTRDTSANILSVPVCSTGRYALFGPTHQMRLPLIRR